MRSRRERARAALARHLPSLDTAGLVEAGRGLDNTVLRLGDLALRVGDPATVGAEAALLRALAGQDLGVPLPAPELVDEVDGVLGYRWLPGIPLLARPAPPGVADEVGRFLRRLHDVRPPAAVPALPREGDDLTPWVDDLTGPDEVLATLRASVPAPGPHRVLTHNDLGAEHLLEADGSLTGVIDWTDAAVSDPAVDFGRLLRDFGPAFLDRAVAAYGGAPDAGFGERVLFLARCAALEDLAYGAQPGREAYRTAASASLAWLFPAG